MKIIKNQIKCNHCGDILTSNFTHEFKWCSCKTVFIDGGLSYPRRGFTKPTDYEELSIYEDEDED